MTPMPPACAMAIAICDSVTVSIAEATIGMLSEIERVMRERISTSEGRTSDRPGLIRTSSKVSASGNSPFGFLAITNSASRPRRAVLRVAWSDMRHLWRKRRFRPDSSDPLLGWRRSISRLAADS
jgi:hypothetical protein